jgi:hypothetical protein
MNNSFTEKERELFLRIDEVLHYVWDPIGVSRVPPARDEYSSYVPQVFSLVMKGADAVSIANHLASIAQDSMGLSVTENSKKKRN